jgi:hypothetical protein
MPQDETTNDDDVLAQTDTFMLWRTREEEGYIYHLELGGVTLHLMPDEWDELVTLVREASA